MIATADPNWNIIVPYVGAVCVMLVAIFGLWDRVKKCFASKIEHDVLKIAYENHVKRFEAFESHTATVIEAQHAKTERLTMELLSELRDRRHHRG